MTAVWMYFRMNDQSIADLYSKNIKTRNYGIFEYDSSDLTKYFYGIVSLKGNTSTADLSAQSSGH